MKLFIWLFLMLGICIKAEAKVYYSEYSEFSDFSSEKVEQSDTVNVETKRIYNEYFDVSEGGYYILGENPINYYSVNTNLYKETEFSVWQDEFPEDKLGRVVESRKVCLEENCSVYDWEFRYKDRLYYHYKVVPKKLESNSPLNGYIQDENDFEEVYRYQNRDKIEVKDSIVITSKDKKIEDFINSTVNYEVKGMINYSKNGIYELEVITSFISVPIKVEVLILGNVKNDFESHLLKQESLIKSLQEQIEIISRTEKEKELLYEDMNLEKEKLERTLSALTIEYNNCEIDKSFLKEKLNNVQLSCKEEQKVIENMVEQNNQAIFNLQNKLTKTIDDNLEKERTISILNRNIVTLENELTNINNKYQRQEDSFKKLKLCNQVNNNLEKKIEDNYDVKRQNLFLFVFISCIFCIIICCMLKIKSMKKNN